MSLRLFLDSLGTEFDPFVTFVTTWVGTLLSFDELYRHLLYHEMRIEQQLLVLDLAQSFASYTTRATMLRGRGYRGGRGSSFGGRGYFSGRGASYSYRGRGSYFNNEASPSTRLVCQFCGRIGHTTARCYQRLESVHSFYSQQQNLQAY